MDELLEEQLQRCKEYEWVAQAIQFIESNFNRQPGLSEVAASVGLSEYHFQRLFTHWAGISPKRFLQYLTKEHAKKMLEESANLLETTYASGLSGPGRLHDLFVVTEAVTPGEYKLRGRGLQICYDFYPSPFGECLIATTQRGICYLAFVDQRDYAKALQEVIWRWPNANIEQGRQFDLKRIESLFGDIRRKSDEQIFLHLRGTNFQLKVWEALMAIPSGKVITYQNLASAVGRPDSARAVGNAVGQNPVPLLIPCHRVIRKLGEFGNYRYGSIRKKALLGWEVAQMEVEVTG